MIYIAPSKLNLTTDEIRNSIDVEKEPYLWKNVYGANCYAYALGIDLKEDRIAECAYQPGVMGSVILKEPIINIKNMSFEERLFLDLEALGIYYAEADPFDETNYRLYYRKDSEIVSSISYSWLISLFEAGEDEFHFLRKGDSGLWIHKYGYSHKPTIYDEKTEMIYDPRECDLGKYQYKKTYKLRLNKKC